MLSPLVQILPNRIVNTNSLRDVRYSPNNQPHGYESQAALYLEWRNGEKTTVIKGEQADEAWAALTFYISESEKHARS